MMTIKDCIDMVDAIKPNQYTIKDKVSWLSFIDEIIINEVLKTHEGYDGRYDAFEGYSEDKLSQALIVPSPYDRVYTAYLKMKIDQENGEVARYNNSATLYNSYMAEFRKHYNKTHMPIDVTEARRVQKKPMASSGGMSEAEYENLVRDLTYILTEHFSDTISHDKLYDVVMEYARNNAEMLKGGKGDKGDKGDDGNGISAITYDKGDKFTLVYIYYTSGNADVLRIPNGENGADGHTPVRGVDYWTYEDKALINAHIASQTAIIKNDVEGLQEQMKEEAHFRGYLSTNAKIQTLNATPNDFAYSAESGTKWIYDEIEGWKNTGNPVPDQLTPASDTMPLINGVASKGVEEAYARGDHRHPTDTTRASAEEVDELKSDISSVLNEIITLQEAFIRMITFNLNGNKYTCPKGMTWAELETYDGGSVWQAENLGKTEAPIYLTSNGNTVTTIDSISFATRNTYISDVIRDVSESISYY